MMFRFRYLGNGLVSHMGNNSLGTYSKGKPRRNIFCDLAALCMTQFWTTKRAKA